METISTSDNHSQPDLYQILWTQKPKEIMGMIHSNHYLVFEFMEVIINKVFRESQTHNATMVSFCISLLGEFTCVYGIPVVLYLNNLEFVIELNKLCEEGFQEQVAGLLELWADIFSFDISEISFIAELWKEINPTGKPNPQKVVQKSKFVDFFIDVRKILSQSEDRSALDDGVKKSLYIDYMLIKNFLEKSERFSDPDFNPLERDLADFYFGELLNMMNALENEKGSNKIGSNKIIEEKPEVTEIKPMDFAQITAILKNESLGSASKPIKIEEESSKIEEEPQSNIPSKAARFKRSFIFKETINEDENKTTEYKDYRFPFNDPLRATLKKTICSFLNRRGGRIYIGIDDNRRVQGITLTAKQRDQLKLEVQDLIRSFEPDIINHEYVIISFLPVLQPQTQKPIPGVFVVKIIVKQGDTSQVYSVNKDWLECYIRNDGRVDLLNARQTTDYIKRRDKNPEKPLPAEDFEDPQPDEAHDVFQRDGNKYFKTAQKRFEESLKANPRAFNSRRNENNANMNGNQNKGNILERVIFPNQPKKNDFDHNSNFNKKDNAPQNKPFHKNKGSDWKEKAGLAPDQEIFEVVIEGLPQFVNQEKLESFVHRNNTFNIINTRRVRTKTGAIIGYVNFLDIFEAEQFIKDVNGKKYADSILSADFNFA